QVDAGDGGVQGIGALAEQLAGLGCRDDPVGAGDRDGSGDCGRGARRRCRRWREPLGTRGSARSRKPQGERRGSALADEISALHDRPPPSVILGAPMDARTATYRSRAWSPILAVSLGMVSFILVKTGRDAVFFDQRGLQKLPLTYMWTALAS